MLSELAHRLCADHTGGITVFRREMHHDEVFDLGLPRDLSGESCGEVMPLQCPLHILLQEVCLAVEGVRAFDEPFDLRDILLLRRNVRYVGNLLSIGDHCDVGQIGEGELTAADEQPRIWTGPCPDHSLQIAEPGSYGKSQREQGGLVDVDMEILFKGEPETGNSMRETDRLYGIFRLSHRNPPERQRIPVHPRKVVFRIKAGASDFLPAD